MAASLAEVYGFLKDCFIILKFMLKNDIQEKNILGQQLQSFTLYPGPRILGLESELRSAGFCMW